MKTAKERLTAHYRTERNKGFRALDAWRNANCFVRWEALDGYSMGEFDFFVDRAPYGAGGGYGPVRLLIVADEDPYDASYVDTWSDVSEAVRLQIKADILDNVARNGVKGIVGQFWNGLEWEHADSCFGFIGDEWEGSGYDVDVMLATLDAYREHTNDIAQAVADEMAAARPDLAPCY